MSDQTTGLQDFALIILVSMSMGFLIATWVYHLKDNKTPLPSNSDADVHWTRKDRMLAQAKAIERIPNEYSQCAANAVINLILEHYTCENTEPNSIMKNALYQEAMRELTSPEPIIKITKVVALKFINGGKVPAVWKQTCLALDCGEIVAREMAFLEHGWCICTPENGLRKFGGCRHSRND